MAPILRYAPKAFNDGPPMHTPPFSPTPWPPRVLKFVQPINTWQINARKLLSTFAGTNSWPGS